MIVPASFTMELDLNLVETFTCWALSLNEGKIGKRSFGKNVVCLASDLIQKNLSIPADQLVVGRRRSGRFRKAGR